MLDIETTQAFITVIDYLSEKFGVVVDTTSKDLLPYLQTLGDKIVAYKESISMMWIIFAVVIGILSLVIFFIGCAKDWECMHWMVLICGLGAAIWIFMANMQTYIACNTFEEKVILDYIETIMKNSQNTMR